MKKYINFDNRLLRNRYQGIYLYKLFSNCTLTYPLSQFPDGTVSLVSSVGVFPIPAPVPSNLTVSITKLSMSSVFFLLLIIHQSSPAIVRITRAITVAKTGASTEDCDTWVWGLILCLLLISSLVLFAQIKRLLWSGFVNVPYHFMCLLVFSPSMLYPISCNICRMSSYSGSCKAILSLVYCRNVLIPVYEGFVKTFLLVGGLLHIRHVS